MDEYDLRPVQLLQAHRILNERFTAVHAIHLADDEIDALGKAGANVCACPTTERNLGDGAVPADRLVEAGAQICFGSDSNIQVDLLEDARALEYHIRMQRLERTILSTKTLFSGLNETGASALGVPSGALEAGRAADFFTVDLDDPSIAGATGSLMPNILFSLERTAIRDVFVNGTQIVRDGHHPKREEVVREFTAVQERLWR
jgi:formimidoylglutamate deiminase